MSLIKCKNCGQMISDNASVCPKCGHKIGNGSMGTIKGFLMGMFFVLALAAIAGVGYYYKTVEEEKAAAELAEKQKTEEKARQEQLCDSIYNNFTSTDLTAMDAKGFVHTIDYQVKTIYERDSSINEHYAFVFDKQGNIIDFKSHYLAGEELFPAKYKRNKEGQINELSVRTSYANGIGESYKGLVVYKFKYDADGRIMTVIFDNQSDAGRGGIMADGTYKFSDYEEEKGFTKCFLKYDDGCGIQKEDVKLVSFDSDDMGNWISKKGRNKKTYTSMDEPTTWNEDMTVTRKIEYYKREEIDFTPYLKH